MVDEGPTLKRWKARARGRVARIKKRTCHITLTLTPLEAPVAAPPKKAAPKKSAETEVSETQEKPKVLAEKPKALAAKPKAETTPKTESKPRTPRRKKTEE